MVGVVQTHSLRGGEVFVLLSTRGIRTLDGRSCRGAKFRGDLIGLGTRHRADRLLRYCFDALDDTLDRIGAPIVVSHDLFLVPLDAVYPPRDCGGRYRARSPYPRGQNS